jgi:hypothetical protein
MAISNATRGELRVIFKKKAPRKIPGITMFPLKNKNERAIPVGGQIAKILADSLKESGATNLAEIK